MQNKQKTLNQLGQRIREAREASRLSQAALAANIGLSDKAISSYEKGRSKPSITTLQEIAKETKRSVSFFTEGTIDKTMLLEKLRSLEKELQDIKKLLKDNS